MAPRLMAVAALLLLSACITAVHCQKQYAHMSFRQWMDAKNGEAKVDSYKNYEESELQGACLRMLNQEQCVDAEPSYAEFDVGCCAEGYHKHQDILRLPDDLKVGRCWWMFYGATNVVKLGEVVQLLGTYEMTCALEENSEKCGEPLCDDLVLRGSGKMYIDPNAAILGQPKITNNCVRRRRVQNPLGQDPAQPTQQPVEPVGRPVEPTQQPLQQPAEPSKRPAERTEQPPQKPAEPAQRPLEHTQQPVQKPAEPVQQPAQQPAVPAPRPAERTQQPVQKPDVPVQQPAQKPALQPLKKPPALARKPFHRPNPTRIASADYYYEEEEHKAEYWLGSATVLDGHVQVISCSKKVAYKEGKTQVIPFYDIYDKATAQPIKPSPEQFIAKPYTMDFILRKANDY